MEGRDRFDLLQRLGTNDLRPLADGRPVTTLLLSPEAHLLARLRLLPGEAAWGALVETFGAASLATVLDRYTFGEDVRVASWPAETARLAVGAAVACPPGVTAVPLQEGSEVGWILAGPSDAITGLEARLVAAGDAEVLDDDAWRALRVRLGVPAAGAELLEEYSPLEAGLGPEISFTKGCYVGQEVVARQDARARTPRRLVRLAFEAAVSAGEDLASEDRAGCRVTTTAPSSEAGEWLALGYVRHAHAVPGTSVRASSGAGGRVLQACGSTPG